MIGRNKLPEIHVYSRAEKSLPLREDADFSTLVVPNGNGEAPVHRWFKYKEAFSSELLAQVVEKYGASSNSDRPFRILDPFCGVGTTLLSAQLAGSNVVSVGIECNPFSAFAAKTKLNWNEMDPSKIRLMAKRLLSRAYSGPVRLPALSSITSERCITRHMARQIVQFRDAIAALPQCAERDALTLGLASAIEPASRVRRDGRALRIVAKRRVVFRTLLAERWDAIAEDVESLQARYVAPGRATILTGDGRQPSALGIPDESIDLILTSPPYPNNIDYNEVYKLELWFLGYATDDENFLALRRSTFRSHPTCSTLPSSTEGIDIDFQKIISTGPIADLMGMVLRRVARLEKQEKRGRTKVLLGYVHDTWQSLRSHFRALSKGGRALYVVGNSLHGGSDTPYLIPTDLILANLARQVGFEVEEITIARGLQRRLAGNHFLRDSIVALRKP